MCPLAFVAGFVDAICGGGGLISMSSFLLAGIPVHQALATNKLQSTFGTFSTTIRYAMNGFMVKEHVAVGVCLGLLGSYLGSKLVLVFDDREVKLAMLVVLPVVAYLVLRNATLERSKGNRLKPGLALTVTACIAFFVGAYDGFIGMGAGTIMLLLLTGVAGAPLKSAAGTAKSINLATNVAALAVFFVHGQVIIPLGLAAAAFNIAGNMLGSGSFLKKGAAIARPVILVVLVMFAIRLLVDLLG